MGVKSTRVISHCVYQGLKHPPIAGSFLDVSFIVKCVCVSVCVYFGQLSLLNTHFILSSCAMLCIRID